MSWLIGEAAGEPGERFGNLDLRDALCWGWCPKKSTSCWVNVADAARQGTWDGAAVAAVDRDLAKNSDACFYFTCQGLFEDLDTGFLWRAQFVADHMLWRLTLENSGKVLPEDAADFFSSEYFLRFARRCGDLIDRARQVYAEAVEPRVKAGEMLSPDPRKVERIVRDVGVARFMDNLRQGRYELA